MTTFQIRANDGPEHAITVQTSIYRNAALAVPALLGLDLPVVIEIWVKDFPPEYGPYFYGIREDECGGVTLESVIFLDPVKRPADGQQAPPVK